MAGIPVHTSSPISPQVATKASAISPSTSTAPYAPASAVTTATATTSTGPPPSARPGAAAVPQPTGAAAPPQPNSFPAPTPTQPLPESSNPPAPQPGAVPVPQNINHRRTESTPISPQTTTIQPNPTSYPPVPLPPHQSPGFLVTPTRAVPPASVTSTSTTPFSGPRDLSHPPGYIQNTRASFEDRPYLSAETNDSSPSPFSLPGNSMNNRRSIGGAGILNGEMNGHENSGSQEEKSVWDTAATWAKAAGKKLSEAEEEVWKRVNGK